MSNPAQHGGADSIAPRGGFPPAVPADDARIEVTALREDGVAAGTAAAAVLGTPPLLAAPPIAAARGGRRPIERLRTLLGAKDGFGAMVVRLLKSSGIYAIAAMASPLISLVLTPFLAHNLTRTDYGYFATAVTVISLATGVSQLGLGSAFFRAYNYDFTKEQDRRAVLATTTALLLLTLLPILAAGALASAAIAGVVLGRADLGVIIVLIAGVILAQNLSVPAFAWMRAEDRAAAYSLLSLLNLLVNLGATIVLVGIFQLGIDGALIAIGLGYGSVSALMLPLIVLRGRLRFRWDIARNLLAFGVPMVGGGISFWILQLSDRELLLHILGPVKGPPVVGSYSVAYTLGAVLSTVIIAPFNLAWPTTMYAIAKRPDAARVYSLIFRYFGLALLFAAFGLSLLSTLLLDVLFPKSYESAALVIPIVALSIAFYGAYLMFVTGVSIRRMTVLATIYMTAAALANLGLNLVLIPRFTAMGAAASTLVAYVLLAGVAYLVNRRIYPIPFEIGRFLLAVALGSGIFAASYIAAQTLGSWSRWPLSAVGLLTFAGCLFVIARAGDHGGKSSMARG
jgi:O-antigen/teichoic acid export membrane protein